MAAIIRSAAIAGAGRQLRRAGQAGAPAHAPLAPSGGAAIAPAAGATPVAQPSGDAASLAREWALLRERQAEQQRAEAQLNMQGEQVAALERQLRDARQELADSQAHTLADAERRGLALGREQAEREAADQIAAQSERINAVLAALSQSRRGALDEQEDMLVEIVFTAVCRMLGATAATPATVEAMVRALVEAEREPAPLRVRLHPHDLAALEQGLSSLDPRLTLLADGGIELGGCQIDGPRGTLDARLEVQLQQLRATLLAVRGAANKNEVPV